MRVQNLIWLTYIHHFPAKTSPAAHHCLCNAFVAPLRLRLHVRACQRCDLLEALQMLCGHTPWSPYNVAPDEASQCMGWTWHNDWNMEDAEIIINRAIKVGMRLMYSLLE
jgi:hypothetical protein